MITNYSREEIKKLVQAGICEVQALRDHDIISALKLGETALDVAAKNRLSERQVLRIKAKYMR